MSNFFKVSLAALVVAGMSVFGASASFAEVGIKGGVSSSFGQYTPGTDADANWSVQSQAQIDVSGGTDSVTAKYRLRVREDSRQDRKDLAAVRHAVNWKTTDALTLEFWGQSFGLGASFVGYSPVGYFGDGYPIGDQLAGEVGFFVNTSGINVDFNLGSMNVGLGLIGGCKPACGANQMDAQTMIPHFRGNFGAIGVGFFMAMGSGTMIPMDPETGEVLGAEESMTSSEMNIGVSYKTDGMKINFLMANTTRGDESTNAGMSLGLYMAGVEAHYVSNGYADADGNPTAANTELAVAYRMKLTDQASMAPQLAMNTNTPEGGDANTKQWVGLGIGTSF